MWVLNCRKREKRWKECRRHFHGSPRAAGARLGQLLPASGAVEGPGPRWDAAEQGQERGADSAAAARLRELSPRPRRLMVVAAQDAPRREGGRRSPTRRARSLWRGLWRQVRAKSCVPCTSVMLRLEGSNVWAVSIPEWRHDPSDSFQQAKQTTAGLFISQKAP